MGVNSMMVRAAAIAMAWALLAAPAFASETRPDERLAVATPIDLDSIMILRNPAEIGETITLSVGRSAVFQTRGALRRVAVADPEIADVEVLEPDQVLLVGKSPGSTDLILWGDADRIWRAKVQVDMDTETLNHQLATLFPDSSLTMRQAGNVYFLTGSMNRADEAIQMREFLEASGVAYTDMSRVPGVQQVQINVRVAEVNRVAIRRLGLNALGLNDDYFWALQLGSDAGGAITPINLGVPEGALATPGLPFAFLSDTGPGPLVSLVAGFPGKDLEFFIQALAENQYVHLLAEPNLVAVSGEEATFLAGGEIPIPVATPSPLGGATVTIEYKEFGVRLRVRPTVLGDGKIRLHVAPEVSDLSPVGGVTIEGFEIPAILTRRSETTLEMYSGQTFAMAGLLNRSVDSRSSRLPVLGDVPVLGPLFRSQSFRSGESELMILVTAALVEPTSNGLQRLVPGEDMAIPNDWEFFFEGRLQGRTRPKADAGPDLAPDFSQLHGPGGWATHSE